MGLTPVVLIAMAPNIAYTGSDTSTLKGHGAIRLSTGRNSVRNAFRVARHEAEQQGARRQGRN